MSGAGNRGGEMGVLREGNSERHARRVVLTVSILDTCTLRIVGAQRTDWIRVGTLS